MLAGGSGVTFFSAGEIEASALARVVSDAAGDANWLRVSQVPLEGVPPSIASVLTQPVRGAVYLEPSFDASDEEAAERREISLAAVLADLTSVFGGIVLDDAGCIYDPAELGVLGHRGGTRGDSTRFLLATSEPRAVSASVHANGAAASEGSIASQLPDGLPDARDATGLLYIVNAPHVPFVEAGRVVAAAVAEPRMPVYVLAPAVDPSELALLAPLVGPPPTTYIASLDTGAAVDVRASAVRREALFFSPLPIGAARAAQLFADFVVDRRVSADLVGEAFADASLVTPPEAEAIDARLPVPIGALRFPGASVLFAQLLLDVAHPALRALASGWRLVPSLLGADIRSVTLAEIVVPDGGDGRDFHRADGLVAAFGLRLATSTFAISALETGALLGPEELQYVVASGRGIHTSWPAWVANHVPVSLA